MNVKPFEAHRETDTKIMTQGNAYLWNQPVKSPAGNDDFARVKEKSVEWINGVEPWEQLTA